MTDRDFKLLIREYFQHKAIISLMPYKQWKLREQSIMKRILSELERFTQQEQQELPFKD